MIIPQISSPIDGSVSSSSFQDGSPALQISYVPLTDIKGYDRELRRHERRKLEKLVASVKAFGLVAPILVNRDTVVLDGHAIVEAAKLAGLARAPIVRIEHLDEPQERALRITLNRLSEDVAWNEEALALEFKDLITFDLTTELSFDLDITGFSSPQRDRLTDQLDPDPRDNADEACDTDFEEPAVSRLGDLWALGEHRLICGCSKAADTYARLLGTERAAMGIHDPPYDLAARFISKRHPGFVEGSGELGAEFGAFLSQFLCASTSVLKPGATSFVFMDWRHMGEVLEAGKAAGLSLINLICWDKGRGGQGSLYRSRHELAFVLKDPKAPGINNVELGKHGRNRTNVWEYPGSASMRDVLELHPTPKSVPMVADAIRDVSHRGGIVLDAFSGSGTTIIAAAKTGRRGYAIDLDPHYVDVAIRRWERWSGELARHAETGLTFSVLSADRTEAAIAPPPTAARIRKRARA